MIDLMMIDLLYKTKIPMIAGFYYTRLRPHPVRGHWLLGCSLPCMCVQVDAVSLMLMVVIYLHLGFAGSHAHAFRVPGTFAATLCLILGLLYGTLCKPDK